MAKIKKIIRDFLIAYIPYAIIAEILAFLFGIEWWKQLVIVASMIAMNMFFNLLYVVLSTYRFRVIINFLRNRKK